MLAGFAEIDITPPLGTQKIGWIKVLHADKILDPLFARSAVLESAGRQVGFIQLDTLFVTAEQTAQVRRRITEQFGFPGQNVMVSATHNHAGPAIASLGDSQRDDAYVAVLLDKIVQVFGQALAARQEAELGGGWCFEFEVAHNRRVVMRDGTVRTHGSFRDSGALCLEGPIDPEVAVLACRDRRGQLLGALVNFACHPAHHGGTGEISAGFPGVLAGKLKSAGCPVTMYLNGACGNLHTSDPTRGGADITKEQAGELLAQDVLAVLHGQAPPHKGLRQIDWRAAPTLSCRSEMIALPYRPVNAHEIAGTTLGACRFVDPSSYDRSMPALLEEIRSQGVQPAEVQVIGIDEFAVAGVPAEYFVELGLRIKERCRPRHALVVELANGLIGYVPHKQAFTRGGYETTFCPWSKLAPEAGDILADKAVALAAET